MTRWCRRLLVLALVGGFQLGAAVNAKADAVLVWNEIAVNTAIANGASPFHQARFAAIVQLAVFEAVNAIEGKYEPYLGTIDAPEGASADAAAIAAAYRVLWTYFAGTPEVPTPSAAVLNAARASSLAAIPDGQAKTDGIAVGEAAAAAMIALRASDGSQVPAFYVPGAPEPGLWQATPTCAPPPASGRGAFLHWRNVTPFGIPGVADFMPGPPPALTSNRYLKDYNEVMLVGRTGDNPNRPQDRTDVARFYAAASPTQLANSAARQIAAVKGDTLSENARNLALINMSVNDSLVVSFATKYHYIFWRPETAILATEGSPFVPFIPTPCFPSYPSNHASGTNGGTEMLRRIYGEGGHDLTFSNTTLGITLHYSRFNAIANDVDDARVYGGIHYRFDQDAGNRLGRAVATFIYKNNLQPVLGQ